jgi:hypothetical protein
VLTLFDFSGTLVPMGSRYSPTHSVATKDIVYPSLVALGLAIVPWIAIELFAYFWHAEFQGLGEIGGAALGMVAMVFSCLMITIALVFLIGGFASRTVSRWIYRRRNANAISTSVRNF